MLEFKQSVFIAIIISVILITVIIIFLYFDSKIKLLRQTIKTAEDYILQLNNMLKIEKESKNEFHNINRKLELNLTAMEADFRNLKERYEAEVTDYDRQLQKFENIANRVLHTQSAAMDEKQKTGMKEVLEPLKERIKSFEEKIEKTNIETVQRHESLKEQMKYLYEKSDQVSKDANNLAKALKGDFKKQGNWGEIILESILDKSGLEKNREYFIQQTERNEQGRMLKPDVVIQLPDGKKLIIDSKVSLVAYENMINGESEEIQKHAHKAHVYAVKTHIDTLSAKNYHDLYKTQSPDFVLMFIPIDTAFSAALTLDPDLYGYAFDKNIVIVTSSTLLATLKTVESMWRNDKQNRFAIEIAEEAGKMYDKFVGFVEDMEKLGKQLHTAQNTYNDSMKKLQTGSGNLVSKAENLKSLGAKANKSLPKEKGIDEKEDLNLIYANH
jgi:DNA recombination protein RmuC